MAKVIIPEKLEKEIDKKFKKQSIKIFELMYSLEENPHKGKFLGRVGNISIKELRYKSFRFYFLIDEYKIKVYDIKELAELLIRFVRMSDKKHQQQTINEIKQILQIIGPRGFKWFSSAVSVGRL